MRTKATSHPADELLAAGVTSLPGMRYTVLGIAADGFPVTDPYRTDCLLKTVRHITSQHVPGVNHWEVRQSSDTLGTCVSQFNADGYQISAGEWEP